MSDDRDGDDAWLDNAPTRLRLRNPIAVETLEPDDLEDTDDGELPMGGMTQKLPAHIDRRALPFERPAGARRGEVRPAFATSDQPPGGKRWSREQPLDRGLDPADLPSAHAPPSQAPATEASSDSAPVLIMAAVVAILALVALALAL